VTFNDFLMQVSPIFITPNYQQDMSNKQDDEKIDEV